MQEEQLFERRAGIVWVCDVANSSARLNDPELRHATEEFLYRFFWLGPHVAATFRARPVECKETIFKWTGDGFLLWAEVPPGATLGMLAFKVFQSAYALGLLVDVTQLGLSSEALRRRQASFTIRHGITYDPEGLVIRRREPNGHLASDVIGRSVVLAFRLSGITVPLVPEKSETFRLSWTGILMQGTLVKAAAREGLTIHYRPKEFSEEELLRYFKGEVWGTDDVFVVPDLVGGKIPAIIAPYSQPLVRAMDSGPEWARASLTQLAAFERRLNDRDAKGKLTQ